MTFSRSAFAATLVLAAAFGASAMAAPYPQQVRIESGALEGEAHDGVLSFKGVPFAAAPVGALRWRAPQRVKAWSKVRAATAYGHDCMQEPFPSDAAPLGTAPDEDCLVLNVSRPAAAAKGRLPVMVTDREMARPFCRLAVDVLS